MAFMSLTSWADDVSFGEIGIGKYTYGDATFPNVVVKDSEGAILTTDYYTYDFKAYTDEACTAANEIDTDAKKAAMKADGTLYYVKVIGKIGSAYEGEKKVVSFTVTQAPLVITYPTADLSRGYGDDPKALDATKFSIDASQYKWGQNATVLKGDHPTSYSTADNEVGDNKEVTFVGGKTADNYNVTYSAKLNITAKALAESDVTITLAKTNAQYAGADITGVYTIKKGTTDLIEGTDWEYKTPGSATNVATGIKPTIKFKGNYSGEVTPTTGFTITKAPLIVSIDDLEVTYNGKDQKNQTSNAKVKFTYSGFVGKDITTKPTITNPSSVAVATEAKNASTYTLKITGLTQPDNYNLTAVDATLTINPIELELAAEDASKSIGDDNPEFTLAAVTGLLAKDLPDISADHVLSGVTFTCDATKDSEAGKYDITPDWSAAKVMEGETEVTTNYSFAAADPKGQLTVGKGEIIVIVKDAEKFYGAADPTFSVKVVGLSEGEELGTVTYTRDGAGVAAKEVPGTYSIEATVANPNTEKYSGVKVYPGTLTIKKAQLTFTMPAQSVVTNDKKNALKKTNIKVTGIKNSDVPENLYELDFTDAVDLVGDDNDQIKNENKTYDAGYKATLTAEADDYYEIITNATTTPVTVDTKITGKLIVNAGTSTALGFTTADDDADYNLIKAHAGETQDVTITLNNRVTREVPTGTAHPWAAETWNTMVLPFEVTVAELSAQLSSNPATKPGYAIVNVVDPSKTTEGNVQFKLEMQKIPANTPFCVKTSEAIPDATMLTFNKKLIVDGGENPSVDAGMSYKFVGAYKNKTIDKTTPTYNFLRGDNNKWAHIGATSANTWTVVPFDAYVELTPAAAARGVTFTFQELDGSFTAIKAIAADVNDEGAAKTGWYTIGGMKLQSAPVKKGLYIHNGKKVIIK